MIAKNQEKIKFIYDQGLLISEMGGWDGFWYYTYPNRDFSKDCGELLNGTSVILISVTKYIDENKKAVLRLESNSERTSLDDLLFVLETADKECDMAIAFKNLTDKCEGERTG